MEARPHNRRASIVEARLLSETSFLEVGRASFVQTGFHRNIRASHRKEARPHNRQTGFHYLEARLLL